MQDFRLLLAFEFLLLALLLGKALLGKAAALLLERFQPLPELAGFIGKPLDFCAGRLPRPYLCLPAPLDDDRLRCFIATDLCVRFAGLDAGVLLCGCVSSFARPMCGPWCLAPVVRFGILVLVLENGFEIILARLFDEPLFGHAQLLAR